MIQELLPHSLAAASDPETGAARCSHRRRGRPLEMPPHELLDRIRALAMRNALFRVHLDEPALYARARRLFGTWACALDAAGLDHIAVVQAARRRSLEQRRDRTAD